MRYCYTEQVEPGYSQNLPVGPVCHAIIAVQVEVWRPFAQGGRPPQDRGPIFWVPHGSGLKKWWAAHKKLTLHDIQLEGTKWVIDRQRERGFKYKEEEAAILGDLQRLKKRLESSDKPIRVDYHGRILDEPNLKRTIWRRPP